MNSSFKKTALASVVAGVVAASAVPLTAEANVLEVSWRGAFTMLNSTGAPLRNSPSDYVSGYYANGDGGTGTSTPFYPGNVGPGATGPYTAGGMYTAFGWKGHRTPVSGTMKFDTSTGAGVGSVNPFFFFGDTPGSGNGTHIARAVGMSFQVIDTIGTIVGSMLFSWNGGGHSVSIVLDGSGMFSQLGTPNNPGPAMVNFMNNGPTVTISGVGAIPATNNTFFTPSTKNTPGLTLPMGPSPIATKTTNALGCEGQSFATQVNAYTINGTGNTANCTYANDTIGGSPMVSAAFSQHNANFDVSSVHLDNFIPTPQGPVVPVPAAVWLFGSGLLGLVGIARRKKKA